MRLSFVVAVACLSLVGLSAANESEAAIRKHTHIPAQDLGAALQSLATHRNFQIVYVAEEVNSLRTQGAIGEFTSEEALSHLLSRTGLAFRYLDERTVTVFPPTAKHQAPKPTSALLPLSAHETMASEATKEESRGWFSRLRLALAQNDQTSRTDSSSSGQQKTSENSSETSKEPRHLEEVIVTAQKRSELLTDVPVPVTVLSADTLAENHQLRLRDYFMSVPGLNVAPAGGSLNQQMLVIRGISSGAFTNPTVGVTVDDVPYGSFTRELAPDIDPSDLSQVEVLRGPQGTLYGASSMGGLLKFVTVDPSTDGVFGRMQADINTVHNGAQPGYGLRGAINVPLTDTLAVRASAFTRQDAGYIDNPILNIKGINKAEVSGGRLSALWRLSDIFSLKLSALYQETKGHGVSNVVVQPGLGDLQQNYIPGVGPYEQKIQAYSAILKGKVGSIDVTSVTGYNVFQVHTTDDYSYLYGPSAQRLFGVSGVIFDATNRTDKFTQEIRASVPIGERLEWLVGGFYTHENTPYAVHLFPTNPVTGAMVPGNFLYVSIPIKFTEYAAFTDLTVRITDRFDVQLGGRESHLDERFETVTQTGSLLANPVTQAAIRSKPSVFTHLVTPRFKVSPDLMVYARVASGYRPGRANQSNPDPLIPRAANPDKTQNYEIGVKGDILDHKLSFDASLYRIDFKGIQINLLNPRNSISYFDNGGSAKSEGAELSVEIRPLSGLRIAAWGTYNNAVLASAFPATTAAYGPAGSRLPFRTRAKTNSVTEA